MRITIMLFIILSFVSCKPTTNRKYDIKFVSTPPIGEVCKTSVSGGRKIDSLAFIKIKNKKLFFKETYVRVLKNPDFLMYGRKMHTSLEILDNNECKLDSLTGYWEIASDGCSVFFSFPTNNCDTIAFNGLYNFIQLQTGIIRFSNSRRLDSTTLDCRFYLE